MNRKQFLRLMTGAVLSVCLGASAQSKTEKKVTLAVSGMSCVSGCGGRVSEALSRQLGVTHVEVKNTKEAEVTYDPEVTNEKKIIEDFNKAGGKFKASKS